MVRLTYVLNPSYMGDLGDFEFDPLFRESCPSLQFNGLYFVQIKLNFGFSAIILASVWFLWRTTYIPMSYRFPINVSRCEFRRVLKTDFCHN